MYQFKFYFDPQSFFVVENVYKIKLFDDGTSCEYLQDEIDSVEDIHDYLSIDLYFPGGMTSVSLSKIYIVTILCHNS